MQRCGQGARKPQGQYSIPGLELQLCLPPVGLEGRGEEGATGRLGWENTAVCCWSYREGTGGVNIPPSLCFSPPVFYWCLPLADPTGSHRAGELIDIILSSQPLST